MKEYDEKEVEKYRKQVEKKQENQQVISTQLKDFKQRYMKQLEEEMLEG